MTFYTDPSYFFDLWKEKMLQDTEEKKRERRRLREQKRFVDSTLQREAKKVRKARNRRQEWNMMAFDKELRPDHHHRPPQSLPRSTDSIDAPYGGGALRYGKTEVTRLSQSTASLATCRLQGQAECPTNRPTTQY
ncbi:hypothetical protein CRUP_028686 [Coryphaenoides rupestris]|nr:hypothetical protein CRUP_028686 [Coryphaenoides rupestris]